jgi:ADP-ribose pyrophosphatase YjhB (NUDIX family)
VIGGLPDLLAPGITFSPRQPPPFPWPESVRPGVAAVVRDGEGRVLLVRRADREVWALPMGRVEPGETVEEAVRREVREETGLAVRVVRLAGLYSHPEEQVFAYPDGEAVQFVTACFLCAPEGGTGGGAGPRPDGREVRAAAFFAPEALPEPFFPVHARWLADALGSGGVAVR